MNYHFELFFLLTFFPKPAYPRKPAGVIFYLIIKSINLLMNCLIFGRP